MSFQCSAKIILSVGPWGGDDGVSWDDGVYSSVRQVVITHAMGIYSIQFEYDNNGASIWSDKHGGHGGHITDTVKLDCPNEFLTSIHGYYGRTNAWGPVLVRSLILKSNKKTYGPFGIEEGTSFSFPTSGGKIVGFYGKSGWFLDSIGAHLMPLQQQNPSKTLGRTQNPIATGTDSFGYPVIEGSISPAVRRKDDFSSKLSRQSSESTSDEDTKEKGSIKIKQPDIQKVPSIVDGVVTYGPWGGSGGTTFDDGSYTGIRQINVARNVRIVYIKVFYDQNGQTVAGNKLGGRGGFKTDKVIFDYPYEILTHITGTYGPAMYKGPIVIKSLTFHTTKGKHGPFGDEQGKDFSTKLKEGKIVGFHGRKGLFLDALGVHVLEGKVVPPVKTTPSNAIVPVPPNNPIVPVHPTNAIVPVHPTNAIVPVPSTDQRPVISEMDHPHWPNKLVMTKQGPAEMVACGVVKEPAPCGPGPWGGEGGRPWDDGVFSGIKQIYLTRGPEAIHSIQIEYDRNGQSVWSITHGGNEGNTMHRVKMEYPHEVLTCISGYYGSATKDERPKVIKSLTFYTSRGKYGPFGDEVGSFFTSTTTEGKVVGFHGRSSLYLDAIGVHMQHWLGNQKTPKSSLFKIF